VLDFTEKIILSSLIPTLVTETNVHFVGHCNV